MRLPLRARADMRLERQARGQGSCTYTRAAAPTPHPAQMPCSHLPSSLLLPCSADGGSAADGQRRGLAAVLQPVGQPAIQVIRLCVAPGVVGALPDLFPFAAP